MVTNDRAGAALPPLPPPASGGAPAAAVTLRRMANTSQQAAWAAPLLRMAHATAVMSPGGEEVRVCLVRGTFDRECWYIWLGHLADRSGHACTQSITQCLVGAM